MTDWLHDYEGILWTLGAVSVVIFFGSLVVVPALAVRIPADYFDHPERPPSRWAKQHRAVRVTMQVLKNMLGCVLILGGLAMLVLPGQGLLTLFIGFMLIDFPRKYRFEKWLIGRPWVHRSLNWLRLRRGREKLKLGAASGTSADLEAATRT